MDGTCPFTSIHSAHMASNAVTDRATRAWQPAVPHSQKKESTRYRRACLSVVAARGSPGESGVTRASRASGADRAALDQQAEVSPCSRTSQRGSTVRQCRPRLAAGLEDRTNAPVLGRRS